MLDKNDINILESMFARQKGDILVAVDRSMNQLMDQKLAKFKIEIMTEIDKKLESLHKQILLDVGDLIDDEFMPYLDKQDRRIKHLERHTNHPPVTSSTKNN